MSAADRAHAVRFYAAVGLGVAAVSTGVLLQGRSRALPIDARDPSAVGDGGVVPWCAQGLEPIAGGACFAAPAAPPKATSLLVYLHGRYAPEGAPEELERQARVARMGTARGYAVVAFRGMQGQCTHPQLATWWCWPSNERNASTGPAFVARWDDALAEVARRTGGTKLRPVLLGFSNGAYFAALIASRNLAPFEAVAIAHGGPVLPMTPAGAMPPVLLVDADDDPSTAEMQRLDAELTRLSWPHAIVIREGGHALPDWDVEMSLTFFERTRSERLPLVPPLSTRARRPPQNPDAGDPELDPPPPAAKPPPASAPVPEPAPVDAPTSIEPNGNEEREPEQEHE